MPAADALLDPGVLESGPVLEFQGTTAVRAHGGTAVLPWRAEYLAARAEGLAALPAADALESGSFAQAVVHLQPSRAATLADVAGAWRVLRPEAGLLVVGQNELGIASFVKQFARTLGQEGDVVANRGKGRIVLFRRMGEAPAAPPPVRHTIPALAGTGEVELLVPPGVFSAEHPDAGTLVLLDALRELELAPALLLDPGSGAGHLAVSALLRWPESRAVLADADWRAVLAARANLSALDLAERAEVHWWDAAEPFPAQGADLVLLNPPWHTGSAVDIALAGRFFQAVSTATQRGARVLVVANRRLPYEAELGRMGRVRELCHERGFKVLEVVRG
jgi:16S rRNA (guanine1207-N2)-methyltransferase